ncbi:peritrophin-48-like [Scaptodrosophila lebanonensis]|uniref:Peritrophin-48-like n=1 Tax=Drosophila lebanonensis TaxID=7225 RepID=A0A6J2T9N6_DROLE|nr:peritrophin-48-like [Scaptodrosophila lebanonensis]
MEWIVLIVVLGAVQLSLAQNFTDQCKGVQYDIVRHPDSNKKYIVCAYGNGQEINCPTETPNGQNSTTPVVPDTCFDSSLKSCTKDACNIPKEPSAIVKGYCATKDPLEKIASVDCGHFYVCLGENDPFYVECPKGQHYSQFDQKCTSPALAKCMTPDKLCANTDKNATFAAENCNEYYVCNTNQLSKRNCAYGYVYSEEAESCVADVAMSCGAHTKPDCSDSKNANTYFAHKDCTKFYMCIQTEVYEGKCATGYSFNSKTSSCQAGVC